MTEKELFTPHIPEVDVRPELIGIFDRARAAAGEIVENENGRTHHQVIIVSPGRLLFAKDCPALEDIPVEQLALLGELVPPSPKVNIAMIGYTYLEALKTDMRKAIPFIDFLLGFAAMGHRVWVFEGHSTALTAGCKDADLLLVDEAIAEILDKENADWRAQALAVMRGETIKLIARQE